MRAHEERAVDAVGFISLSPGLTHTYLQHKQGDSGAQQAPADVAALLKKKAAKKKKAASGSASSAAAAALKAAAAAKGGGAKGGKKDKKRFNEMPTW